MIGTRRNKEAKSVNEATQFRKRRRAAGQGAWRRPSWGEGQRLRPGPVPAGVWERRAPGRRCMPQRKGGLEVKVQISRSSGFPHSLN